MTTRDIKAERRQKLGAMMRAARRSVGRAGVTGCSATRMAGKLGLSRSAIERWETGRIFPPRDRLEDYLLILIRDFHFPREKAQQIYGLAFPDRILGDRQPTRRSLDPRSITIAFQEAAEDVRNFSTILADDLKAVLSQEPALFVAGRPTMSLSTNALSSTTRIAAEIPVKYILHGIIGRRGAKLFVRTNLVDAENEKALWTGRYSAGTQDYALDEVVNDIGKNVFWKLGFPERASRLVLTSVSLDAREAITACFTKIDLRTRSAVVRARELAEHAVQIEDSYALAHAVRAYVLLLGMLYRWFDKTMVLKEAQKSAERALSLDETEAWGHVALGFVRLHTKPLQDALSSFRSAIERNRSLAIAHTGCAAALCYLGRGQEALEQVAIAESLNPHERAHRSDLGINKNVRATAHFVLNEYEEGIQQAYNAITENPGIQTAHRNLVVNCALANRVGEARDALARLKVLDPEGPPLTLKSIEEGLLFDRKSDRDRYLKGFRIAGLR